jgi:hypothetical protein
LNLQPPGDLAPADMQVHRGRDEAKDALRYKLEAGTWYLETNLQTNFDLIKYRRVSIVKRSPHLLPFASTASSVMNIIGWDRVI